MADTWDLLKQVIENERKSFVPSYQKQATDEECLGLALSHYFEHGGESILKTCYSGLEDANFYSENEVIELLIDGHDPQQIVAAFYHQGGGNEASTDQG